MTRGEQLDATYIALVDAHTEAKQAVDELERISKGGQLDAERLEGIVTALTAAQEKVLSTDYEKWED